MKNLKDKKRTDQEKVKTTGHSWDGIEENDLPDPFWLRGLFYITLFFALGYWFLYPSFPSQDQDGILNWSQYKQMQDGLDEIKELRKVYQEEFDKKPFEEILKDEKLMKFALTGGRIAFLNNCAMCHGSGAQGNVGYPNLTTGAWLWGGKVEDIQQTLFYGIRSGHEETRESQMAAFGRDGLLKKEQIEQLVHFVMGLSKGEIYSAESNKLFQANCASCHGAEGKGNYEFGAPNLSDAVWLYGPDYDTIYDVIYNGRGGVMPYWKGRLDDSTIKQLSIYVHSLGGGE